MGCPRHHCLIVPGTLWEESPRDMTCLSQLDMLETTSSEHGSQNLKDKVQSSGYYGVLWKQTA